MKTYGEIRFDYQNAMAQAKRLDELADSIDRRVAGKLEESAQSIHAAWKGDTSTRYIRKTQTLKEEIRKTARTLRETAADIRRIAQALYNAEMQALEIARKREA